MNFSYSIIIILLLKCKFKVQFSKSFNKLFDKYLPTALLGIESIKCTPALILLELGTRAEKKKIIK